MLFAMQTSAQLVCTDPSNVIYGSTNVGRIYPITVSTGAVGAAINPPMGGNAPSFANANGYNPLNGRFYFFKRNLNAAPVEFMCYDPATGVYTMLAPHPGAGTNIINLGCVNNSGLGYYCMDAFGALYYYHIATNTWTTVCTNIRNQWGTTLSSIIDATGLQRYYGDLAIDGLGNMWLLVSGAVDYGLYKISGPIPTSNVANMTAMQLVPPNTASPAGSFGGAAFASNGDMYLASNSPNNRLYKLNLAYTLSFVSNLALDGVGNDLTSCNFPFGVLAASWVNLSASMINNNTAKLQYSITESTSGYGYTVEYSIDGANWNEVHFSARQTNDLTYNYTYTQSNLANGTHYFRIRKNESNGTVAYSTVKKLTVSSNTSISIWPNPVQQILKVQDGGNTNGTSQFYLHDQAGRMLKQSSLQPGVNNINVESLPAGTYFIRVKTAEGVTVNQKFIKQ
jgi:hypothetical protein